MTLLGDGPFTTATALTHLPEWELYGPGYQQVVHGVHMAADLPADHADRVRAIRMRVGPDAVLVGPTAAWANGSPLVRGDDILHVAGPNPRRTDDVVVHRLALQDWEVAATPWGPATVPARTMADVARGIGADDSSDVWRVMCVDSVANGTGVSVQEARDLLAGWRRRKGVPRGRRVLALARDGAESPQESRLRLTVGRHGFPDPHLQHEVVTPGGEFLARLDMAWPWRRVGLEYDGAHHRSRDQYALDLARHNRLRAAGWIVLQVDVEGMREPERWLDQLLALLT